MRTKYLVTVFLALALLLAFPGAALAGGKGKPQVFEAQMLVAGVAPGMVTPVPPPAMAGQNIRWLVDDRAVYGLFITGAIEGEGLIVYNANVDLTQQGRFRGSLTIDDEVGPETGTIYGKLTGRSLVALGSYLWTQEIPDLGPGLWDVYSATLSISGGLTLQAGTGDHEGVQGTGTFAGELPALVAVQGPVSHVVALWGVVELQGQWHQ